MGHLLNAEVEAALTAGGFSIQSNVPHTPVEISSADNNPICVRKIRVIIPFEEMKDNEISWVYRKNMNRKLTSKLRYLVGRSSCLEPISFVMSDGIVLIHFLVYTEN